MHIYFTLLLLSLTLFSNCQSQDSTTNKGYWLPKGTVIDSIVVHKAERTLEVYSTSKKIKTYSIALGKQPIGKKQLEGDMKTPEGLYFIDTRSTVSQFHKNLNISYPNAADSKYAASLQKSAGGEIKIHGLPNGFDEKKYSIQTGPGVALPSLIQKLTSFTNTLKRIVPSCYYPKILTYTYPNLGYI
jgi:murein L,D-transpeptidase YafK